MGRHRYPSNNDLLVQVAKLYFEGDASQIEIARKYNISRSSVSLLLKRCREEGIVQIQVLDKSSSIQRLQRDLAARFSLRPVVIVPSGQGTEQAKVLVGKAAADLIDPLVKDGLRIGMSWGSTLYQFVENVAGSHRKKVEVVLLHGGLGTGKQRHLTASGLLRNSPTSWEVRIASSKRRYPSGPRT